MSRTGIGFFTILFYLLFPLKARGAFSSQNELFNAFSTAGFEHVMEIPGGDFSGGPNIKIYDLKKDHKMGLAEFASGNEERVEDLDYVYNSQALLSRALQGKQTAQAFQVADVLLCYRNPSSKIGAAVARAKGHTPEVKWTSCYLFPVEIKEVVKAVKETSNI